MRVINNILSTIPEGLFDMANLEVRLQAVEDDELVYMCVRKDTEISEGPIVSGVDLNNHVVGVLQNGNLIWVRSVKNGIISKEIHFNESGEITGKITTKDGVICMKDNKLVS